jgi:endonuclease/exonuclease/phosphatase family metal-dependent hydrolase
MSTKKSLRLIWAGMPIPLLLLSVLLGSDPAPAHDTPTRTSAPAADILKAPELTVLTLNLAHGRKDSLNQTYLSSTRIKDNLREIAAVLSQTNADVIALQEADGPSRWSGGFDHVATIAADAQYPVSAHSIHATSWLFSFGTALLSRTILKEVQHHSFSPSPPTLNKGFTFGLIKWQPDGHSTPVVVDLASVHLDFSRNSVRAQQISEISSVLNARGNPRIIMGDLNSDWFSKGSVLRALAEKQRLHVYRPHAQNMATYKSTSRLDWILISEELEFTSYRVLPQVLSDHSAVLASVRLRPSYNQGVTQELP